MSIPACWAVFFGFMALRLAIIRFPHEGALLERNALMVSAGMALNLLLFLALRRLRRLDVALQIAAGTVLAVPLGAALTWFTFWVRYLVAPAEVFPGGAWRLVTFPGFFAREVTELFLMYAGWSALYGSVANAIVGREAERRAAEADIARRDAQLAALRNQLNPHFLFNALNSISALLLRGNTADADAALGTLSLFLRHALSHDGDEDVRLADEVEWLRLYLAIEQMRFGDRLRIRWDIPPELGAMLLPPSLLQPLAENVARHAVGVTDRPVVLEVRAFACAGALHVVVDDDGPGGSGNAGHGIGLPNVAARLALRYGGRARLRCGARPGGGFRAELELPGE